jgi:hypothetical protein
VIDLLGVFLFSGPGITRSAMRFDGAMSDQ